MALTLEDVLADLPAEERERIEAAGRRMAEEYSQVKAAKAGSGRRYSADGRMGVRRGHPSGR